MARINKKAKDYRKDKSKRLAGGYGVFAARQDAEALLRRAVMTCMLWEKVAYQSGSQVAENIKQLIPQVSPVIVAQIAIEARTKQKLRHVPLFIAREMARIDTHKYLVGEVLKQIVLRPDELTEFMAIYWQDGKQPISKQVKLGLASAFTRFSEYQLAKYNRNTAIKLRDVLFVVHAKPKDAEQDALWKRLIENKLIVPDTWEVELSQSKDKKTSWERLLIEHKLGAMAFMRNLRNYEQSDVDQDIVRGYFEWINPKWLLPINYFAAAKHAPRYEREIEKLMLRGFENFPKLMGSTIFVIDVSGSMYSAISNKSESTRLDVAKIMTVLASEVCNHFVLYATAGRDSTRVHQTKMLKPRRGFALCDELQSAHHSLGGGGIFTRQCLEYIAERERKIPDRIIVFSDSQDCDYPEKQTPKPFGIFNYIIDVSNHSHGVNYDGLWTAEVSGWSEHFLTFIAETERVQYDNPQ